MDHAHQPALARQRTFGALARSRKLEVTNTTLYSWDPRDESRVIFYLILAPPSRWLRVHLAAQVHGEALAQQAAARGRRQRLREAQRYPRRQHRGEAVGRSSVSSTSG